MPVDFDYKALGKLLASEIDATGRGYRANCAEIGISIASVTHLKHGQPVAVHTVLRACEWLGVSIDRFTCHTVKQAEKQAVEKTNGGDMARIRAAMKARGAEGRRA